MRALHRIRNYLSAMSGARRNRTELVGKIARRPLIAGGATMGGMESAMLLSNSVDPKLKELAELKAAGDGQLRILSRHRLGAGIGCRDHRAATP